MTNTNYHIAFDRMFARGATSEIDATFSNPAGLAWGREGFQLSLNFQKPWQRRNIELNNTTYEGVASAPIVPALFAAYKKDRIALSAMIGIVGSGGFVKYDQGVPQYNVMVQSMMSGIIPQLNQLPGINIPTNYALNSEMKGKQYIYGGQLNFTYKLLDIADLTCDGSLALGGCVCAVLVVEHEANPWLALLAGTIAGMLASGDIGAVVDYLRQFGAQAAIVSGSLMVLQSLAPYYEHNEAVKTAVDNALRVMSENQLDDGGFLTYGSPTPESCAQMLTALCSLGIDPQKDSRFIKNGRSVLDRMLDFSVENGFEHLQNDGFNQMSTEQAFYAMTALNRLENGKTALYDMSDLLLPYDVNLDGQVNIIDATETQKYIAELRDFNLRQQKAAHADVNGKVNITVVTEIQRFISMQ